MLSLVVDSSVWIDFFNKKTSPQIEDLKYLLFNYHVSSPLIILPVIMQEILQGIENQRFYNTVKENLQGLKYLNYDPYLFAVSSAELYRVLKTKGITVRKANDCLIASLCIENNFQLMHNDKDFDNIAKHTSLKIYKHK